MDHTDLTETASEEMLRIYKSIVLSIALTPDQMTFIADKMTEVFTLGASLVSGIGHRELTNFVSEFRKERGLE